MAPASGPVSGAGTADTLQLYGSTAWVFWWRPAATGFAALAIATRLLTHEWQPGRDRDARRRGPPARHTAAVCRRPRRGARRRRLRTTLGPRRPRVPGRCASERDGPLGETARPAGAGPGGLAARDRGGDPAVGERHPRRRRDAAGLQPRAGTWVGADRPRHGESGRRTDRRHPTRRTGRGDVASRAAVDGCRGDAVVPGRRQDVVVRDQHGRSAVRRPPRGRRGHLR